MKLLHSSFVFNLFNIQTEKLFQYKIIRDVNILLQLFNSSIGMFDANKITLAINLFTY